MSISIQTNVNSLVAQQNLSVTNKFQSQTITQLTSGYRINSSGDDAAGLAVANKFRSNVAELTQGVSNGNDAVAQLQIMDGGMSNISQILDRLKTLATQSASGTFTGNRQTLNKEFQDDLAEIDRQAQSIGLDTGGTFAKSLSVYLGQGSGSGDGTAGAAATANAMVGVDLSHSMVDSQSLGLKGMEAIAGTVSANGTDIGTGSASTTVQDILAAGNTEATSGYATFYLSGPGFSDNNKVAITANMRGVTDAGSLADAINSAITNAATTSTALKSANIVASVNSDQYGHQQLAFSSGTTAFQVQAGDQLSNAFMGNFNGPNSAQGKQVTSTVTGGTMASGPFNASGKTVQISGAGLAGPVSFTFGSDATVAAAATDLVGQISQNKQLQSAGISAQVVNNQLVFTGTTGETFNVAASGDTANQLGLGTFVTGKNGAVSYSSVTAASSLAQADTGNGVATLGFSLDGGTTGGITAATITGSAAAAGYSNGTVSNAAGALGSMTLTLNGGVTVNVDFATDANQSGTETLQQAANFINSQIQSQAGYGSDVKLASVNSATNTIELSGPPDGSGSIAAAGNAATALGLTQAAGAQIVNASGSTGNTVSVNLAGDDATAAVATGSGVAPTTVATGTSATMALNIDGTAVNANFANDVNAAGSVAQFASTSLGNNGANSTVNLSGIQGSAATLASGVLGANGATSTINLSGYGAIAATTTASGAITGYVDGTTGISMSGFAAGAAKYQGTSLGATSASDVSLNSLDLSQFAAKTATAIGGSFGSDMNAAVDLSQFAATAATTTGSQSLSGTLNLSSLAATNASISAQAAPDNTSTISALASLNTAPENELTINGTGVNISGCTSLDSVVSAINTAAIANITASDAGGVLTIKNTTTGSSSTLDIAANSASAALGITAAGASQDVTATGADPTYLKIGFDGHNVENIDISGVTSLTANNATGLVYTINHALNVTHVGDSYDASHAYAVANSDGTITFNGYGTGSSGGSLHIVNNDASQALGVASGVLDTTATGADDQELYVNINGKGSLGVHVSGATTVGQVAAAIDSALASATTGAVQYGASYGSGNVATAANGAIQLKSITAGSNGTVDVTDNAVARALKLTSGTGDLQNLGQDGTALRVKIDSGAWVNVNVSGATTASAVVSAINTQVNTAYSSGSVTYASLGTTVGTDDGSIKLAGVATGGTNGKVQIEANAVSHALGLTAGSTSSSDVTAAGKNATTLDVQVDGGAWAHVDLTTCTATTPGSPTAGEIATAIQGALRTATGNGSGTYCTNSSGTLTVQGTVTGGSLTIKDNALSEALKLTSAVTKTDTVISRANQTLNLEVDGKNQINIALDSLGGNARLVDIASAINSALVNSSDYGQAYANVAKANADGTISLTGISQGGSVKVLNSALSTTALKLTTSGSDATNTGAAATTLNVSIDGKATKQISFANMAGGSTPTLSQIANVINAAFTGDAAYGAAYANVAKANADGTLSIAGMVQGTTGSVSIANNGAGTALNLTQGGGGGNVVQNGGNESIADVVSFLNSQAQQQLGTSNTAQIVSLNSDGNIVINSQTKGAASTVSVLSTGTTAGLAASMNLSGYVDHAATGQSRSMGSIVNSLMQQFNGNATLQEAGLTAVDNNGSLEIQSSNGTQFRLDSWGTTNSGTGAAADLGFGATGQAFTAATAATQSQASVLDAQGASTIGTYANGTNNTPSLSFQAMQFGDADQSITISAVNRAGVAQPPLTLTLANDDKFQNGASIDAAVSYLNTKLQQSNNAALQSITAVKETDAATGAESINFLSPLSSFSVSVGTSAGGQGLNGGVAKTFSSAVNGSASNMAIDTEQGAQAALTAISAAVAKLGSAQAVVGIGQNQLNYAISLAQSQITNFSAAESQIRDANVAQQAANLSKAQVLSQASIAAMAQANSAPQGVLALLRG